jgi:hypothetical protein
MRFLIQIKRFIPRMLRPPLAKFYRHLFRLLPRPLTASEKQFIRENSTFWKQYVNQNPSRGFVLVECKNDPISLISNGSHAAIVSRAKNLSPLFMLWYRKNNPVKRILETYPDANFVFLDDHHYLDAKKQTDILAKEVFQSFKCPEDIIKFEIDGIKFGNLIYDSVLYMKFATIREINDNVLNCLQEFFWYRHIVQDIIKKYKIETSIFSQGLIGLMTGTFTRYLLQNEIEIMSHLGAGNVILKKFQTLNDVGQPTFSPDPRYLSLMKNWPDDSILKLADEYLDYRFNKEVFDISRDLVFDPSKRSFKSREDFSLHFGLDPSKRLVFVMLHSFNDWPRSYFEKPMIYRDYCDWFEKTLEIAKTVESINWIFKEHPSSELYPTEDFDLDAVFESVQYPHIRFLNNKADFGAASLRYIADTILTCAGTAGLEYSCLGIPCVLGGPSHYSGLGFTIEPRDAAEYEDQLRSLADLDRLNADQIKTAKLALFLNYSIMINNPYLFCPDFRFEQIVANDPTIVWRETAELMRTGDRQAMDHQIKVLSQFFKTRTWTLFVNLEGYPFLKGAIEGI